MCWVISCVTDPGEYKCDEFDKRESDVNQLMYLCSEKVLRGFGV